MWLSPSPQRAVLAAKLAVIEGQVGTGGGTEKRSSEWQLGERQLEDGVGRDPAARERGSESGPSAGPLVAAHGQGPRR